FSVVAATKMLTIYTGLPVCLAFRMNSQTAAQRRCLACGAAEPVPAGGPIWPLGWRCPGCGQGVIERDGIPVFAPALADTISGMDPKNFDSLAIFETEYFWFVARYALIVGLIDKYFPDARRFLEIGCGNGAVLQAIARSRSWERLVGTELHHSGLAYARKRVA